MRVLKKLVRNGNSTQITIPFPMLASLGWLAGEYVIVEILENDTLTVRYPNERDLVKPSKRRAPRMEPVEVQP